MRRGTTTTHRITTGVNLSNAKVYLTYVQGTKTVLERTSGDTGFTVGEEEITNVISQAESFLFAANTAAKAQLRWVDSSGVAGSSNIFNFNVEDVLKPGEISYGTQYTVSISGESEVEVGSTIALSATTTPAGEAVDWSSSDDSIATVTSGGVVKGVAEGSVVITATMHDHQTITATKEITITSQA